MATVSKDPAIKLFGRTISLPEAQFSEDSESMDNGSGMTGKANTEDCGNETSGVMDEAASLEPCKAEEAQTSLQQSCNSQVFGKTQSHHEESDDSEEPKPCKRPDKIIPCPRCNSLETKFCYFNNYNVNQPRHFCKSCQRYWTAGGTVRNVPVGAGRRRNKYLATQYRQVIASSDGGPTTSDTETHLLSSEQSTNSSSTSSPKEMVLKFGPESPHCESAPNLLCQSQINVSSLGVEVINSDLSMQQPSYQSTPNISVQFVPVPYWNCVPVWVAGAANMPLSVTNGDVCPPFRSSAPRIQILGKHPRELNTGDITGDALSLPKTLRTHGLDGV